MRKGLIALLAILGASAIAIAAIITFTDDDPVQFATITQQASPPAGAELHMYLKTSEQGSFTDLGTPPIGTQFVIFAQGPLPTGFTNDTLYVQLADLTGYSFQAYTQYQMYVPDLDSTLYGPTGDTIQITIGQPTLPIGEGFTVTVDK